MIVAGYTFAALAVALLILAALLGAKVPHVLYGIRVLLSLLGGTFAFLAILAFAIASKMP